MFKFSVEYKGSYSPMIAENNITMFACNLGDYIKRNTEQEESIKNVKIEGRGPGSRLIRITFSDPDSVTLQHVEIHDDNEEERLLKELIKVYRASCFCVLKD